MPSRDAAPPTPTPRAELIADTAIALLASRGLRGLTHRAVDEAAGLPQGSTSNHARTRAALLETTVRRLAVREGRVLTPDELPLPAGEEAEEGAGEATEEQAGQRAARQSGQQRKEQPPQQGQELEPGALADQLALALHRYLTHNRPLLVARYELALEATRRPELRTHYDRTGAASFAAPVTRMLKAAGSTDPRRHTLMLVSWCDGVLFSSTAGTFNAQPPTEAELRASVREMLAGMLGAAPLGGGATSGSRRRHRS